MLGQQNKFVGVIEAVARRRADEFITRSSAFASSGSGSGTRWRILSCVLSREAERIILNAILLRSFTSSPLGSSGTSSCSHKDGSLGSGSGAQRFTSQPCSPC